MNEEIKGIELTSSADRTLSAEVMTSVAANLAQEGLVMDAKYLGKSYVVGKPIVTNFVNASGKSTPSVKVPLKNNEGTIYMPMGKLNNARILSSDVPFDTKKSYNGFKGTILRTDANEIWDKSAYFHTQQGVEKGKEFPLPATIHLAGIVIGTMPDGTPRRNGFLYNGYRLVFLAYTAKDKQLSWDDFCSELKKDEGRIEGLSTSIRTPQLIRPEVAELLSSTTFTLVLKDVPAKGE